MRDLEIVLCRLHSRFQPRSPRFKLCPECRADAPREAVVDFNHVDRLIERAELATLGQYPSIAALEVIS